MILLAQSSLTEIGVLAALGVVIGWLLLRTHRQLSRRNRGSAPIVKVARPEKGERGHHLDWPSEARQWEVEMHETARELSARLDSKMGALQALIAEADRAAARLEEAARLEAGPPMQDSANGPVSASIPTPSESGPATQAEALRPTGQAERSGGHNKEDAEEAPLRRGREEIYRLADRGLSPADIARYVETPVGEVELILGLRVKD